jgi:hypothetical protein
MWEEKYGVLSKSFSTLFSIIVHMHLKYSDKKKYQNIYCSNMLLVKFLIEVKGKLIYKNQLLIKINLH